ncbi:MAG: hypothetical protein ACREA0_24045 [bacterium]
MPRKRRTTFSDTPSQRQLWERAAKREEEYVILELNELFEHVPPPPGWRKRRRAGRPRKTRKGHQEEFGWKDMAKTLLLKAYHYATYREIASHLAAHPEVARKLGLKRAPSHSTIQQANKRLPERWWRHVNSSLVSDLKKGVRVGRQTRNAASTRPATSSKE